MKVIAFLQNMWVRDPERVKRDIARHGEECRLRYIEYCLFAGCLTGRRLEKAFGQEICSEILWEESTREIAGDPKTIFPPQPEHIRAVIVEHKPTVILAFGKIASDAVFKELSGGFQESLDVMFIAAPHPAARQPDTIAKLNAAAEKLRKTIPNWCAAPTK